MKPKILNLQISPPAFPSSTIRSATMQAPPSVSTHLHGPSGPPAQPQSLMCKSNGTDSLSHPGQDRLIVSCRLMKPCPPPVGLIAPRRVRTSSTPVTPGLMPTNSRRWRSTARPQQDVMAPRRRLPQPPCTVATPVLAEASHGQAQHPTIAEALAFKTPSVPEFMQRDLLKSLATAAQAISTEYSKRAERMWQRFLFYCQSHNDTALTVAILAFLGSLAHAAPSTKLSYLALLLSKLSRLNMRLASDMLIKDFIKGLRAAHLRAPKKKAMLIDLQLLQEAIEKCPDPEMKTMLSFMTATGCRFSDVKRAKTADVTLMPTDDNGAIISWKQMEGKTITLEQHQITRLIPVDATVATTVREKKALAPTTPLSNTSYRNALNFMRNFQSGATTYSIRRTVAQKIAETMSIEDTAKFLGHRAPTTTNVYVDAAPRLDVESRLAATIKVIRPKRQRTTPSVSTPTTATGEPPGPRRSARLSAKFSAGAAQPHTSPPS